MDQPNVLVLVLDALRYDALSMNGYRRNGLKTSPNIDEFAEEATVYENAIATGPSTNLSQTALTTGKYPSNMDFAGVFTQLGDEKTIAERLKEKGYRTQAIHTAVLNKDQGFAEGFDNYREAGEMPKFRWKKNYIVSGAYNLLMGKDSRSLHKNLMLKDFMESEEPFFSYACYTNTHNPYRATRKFKKRFERKVEEDMDEEMIDLIAGAGTANEAFVRYDDLTEDEIDVIRSRYDASLAYLDYRLGQLFEHMKENGIYDDTMIVVTSDHGELFGEEGKFYHALSSRQELVHVPLIVKYPGQKQQKSVEEAVSLIDLYPTILEEAGLDPGEADHNGFSLHESGTTVPLTERARPREDRIEDLREKGMDNPDRFDRGVKTAQDREFKLFVYSDGEKRLVDLEKGKEIEDEEKTQELKEKIEERLSGFWDGETSIEVEEEIKDELERLGYF